MVSVTPVLLELAASTGDAPLMVGDTSTLTVTLRNPAPASGVTILVSLSNSARATLGASQLSIAAGTTTANTTLTATQTGSVVVRASWAGTAAASLRASIVPVAVSRELTSDGLIEAALQAGEITSEQALIYRVQAAFGSPDLPPQYLGNSYGVLDTVVGREASQRFGSLSPAAQEALLPYLFPPTYSGSWGTLFDAQGALQARTASALTDQAGTPCFFLPGVSDQPFAVGWAFIRTENFKVWYQTTISYRVEDFYTAEDARQAAVNVASSVEYAYARLKSVFGPRPLSDAAERCNGGDDAMDIYVHRVSFSLTAQVMPYPAGGCGRPGWMYVAPDEILDPKDARNIVAHELVHFFQLIHPRPECDDWRYGILDEAMATWAFDHVYPNDNFEHRFASPCCWGSGYFDSAISPMEGEWRASILNARVPVPQRGGNGYADYPFFEWLSRKYGPQTIRDILEASSLVDAQQAFELGLSRHGGGLEKLWPKFALAAWNDWDEGVADEFYKWENFTRMSIKHAATNPAHYYLEADLQGRSRRDMWQEIVRFHHSAIEPMAAEYLNIKFTDPSVSYVIYENRSSTISLSQPRFHIDALLKIDGRWKEPEDWTHKPMAWFCRDKKDERIEELVLIYSNSHPGDESFSIDPPTGVHLFDEDSKLPKLRLSNAGCYRWRGTSSTTVTLNAGGITEQTATVLFERYRDPRNPEGRPGTDAFRPISGTATVRRNGSNGVCTESIPLTQGAIGSLDGEIDVFLDDYDNSGPTPLNRRAIGGGETAIPNVSYTLTCPVGDPIVETIEFPSNWLVLPVDGTPLSDDGRTITGSETVMGGGTTQTAVWSLTAEEEP
jgi:hypothetical protein